MRLTGACKHVIFGGHRPTDFVVYLRDLLEQSVFISLHPHVCTHSFSHLHIQ